MGRKKEEIDAEVLKLRKTSQKLSLVFIYWGLCRIKELQPGNFKRLFDDMLVTFHNKTFPANTALTPAIVTKGYTSLNSDIGKISDTLLLALDSMEAFFAKLLPEGIKVDHSDPLPLQRILKNLLTREEFQQCVQKPGKLTT